MGGRAEDLACADPGGRTLHRRERKYKHCSFQIQYKYPMTSTPNNTPNTGRSLDRQITTQDVLCLREAFSLFDIDRKEDITTMELGKVMHKT